MRARGKGRERVRKMSKEADRKQAVWYVLSSKRYSYGIAFRRVDRQWEYGRSR